MRVIRAFQSTTYSSHPSSLTTSTADRLRASYRRLQVAREREEQKRAHSLRPCDEIQIANATKDTTTIKFV
ncbi:hypothetical protein Tcan_13419 [Toxocara canis]|nr:hypothetical protein Tcan_13419 [Toxocara canis]